MNPTITSLFYIKRAKPNKQGLVPIFQRVTINGKRIERSTTKYIDPDQWSVEGAKMKGKSDHARSINNHLDTMLQEVIDTEKDLTINRKPVSYSSMKTMLSGAVEIERTILAVFQEHNDKMLELVPSGEYAIGTWKNFRNTFRHLKKFFKQKRKTDDISIHEIDYALVMDFDFYLKTKKIKCSNNSVIKHMHQFAKVYNICLDNEWTLKDPFKKYKSKVTPVDRGYLNEHEVAALYPLENLSEKLELVRDIFVFSCYTGLAYIDVYNLTPGHITIGIDGDKWIFINRQKTEAPSHIPLLPIAQQIIDKYKNHPKSVQAAKALPILSNQKMNQNLKELAEACGISKRLTFHLARHTFATTITLTNGVPLESVGKMLGHRSIKSTQIYARVLDEKLSQDMAVLKQKISLQNSKGSCSHLQISG
jgi:site-specific recombinase XerD